MKGRAMDDRQALKVRFANFGNQAPPPVPQPPALTPVPINDTLSEPKAQPVMRPGFDKVQLKVRRTQNRGFAGGVGFSVHFIAELSVEARNAVKHYGLGSAVLYQKDLDLKMSGNIFVALWRLLWLWLTRKKWRVTVNDLVQGRTLTAKDVIDMLSIEDDMRKAADTFAQVLRAASYFGGEEVIEL